MFSLWVVFSCFCCFFFSIFFYFRAAVRQSPVGRFLHCIPPTDPAPSNTRPLAVRVRRRGAESVGHWGKTTYLLDLEYLQLGITLYLNNRSSELGTQFNDISLECNIF